MALSQMMKNYGTSFSHHRMNLQKVKTAQLSRISLTAPCTSACKPKQPVISSIRGDSRSC